MKNASLMLTATAVVAASWAVPAQAREVALFGDGTAYVCDGAWSIMCWDCFGPPIETDSGGWECFPAALKRPSAGRRGARERRNGWDIVHAPKSSNAHFRMGRVEYRKVKARTRPAARGSARVVAELRKLFPERARPASRAKHRIR